MMFRKVYVVNSTTPHSQAIASFSYCFVLPLRSLSRQLQKTTTMAIWQCCFISTYPLGHTGEYFTFNQEAFLIALQHLIWHTALHGLFVCNL